MAAKLIAVFGATGKQGGSVARALLKDSAFVVRAVTRNPNSEAALKLKEQGAELCTADVDNKESLATAVKDAYGCFLVTDFFSHFNVEREIKQGVDVLEACKTAGVKHLIYSGLESAQQVAGISVPHFESKAAVEDRIRESGIQYTIVRIAMYHENFFALFLNKTEPNTFGIGIPMGDIPVPLIEVEGTGGCVRSILNNPDKYSGQTIGLASDRVTVDQMAEAFNKHLGPSKKFFNFKVTPDAFAKLGFPGADEIANMFRYYQTDKSVRDIPATLELNPDIVTFDKWVEANKDAFNKHLDNMQ